MDKLFRVFLVNMWERIANGDKLYMVVIKNSIPYLLAPDLAEQNEEYLEGSQQESQLMVFLDEKDAEEWGAMILEIFEKDNPKLNVVSKTLQELFENLDELNTLSMNEFKHPVRIDVATKYNDNCIGSDILYSNYRPAN